MGRAAPRHPCAPGEDLVAADGLPDRALGRVDAWLDRRVGYHPLAIRLNYRHGFHVERMQPGHPNWMLDTDRDGPLPHRPSVERAMERWFFSARRHVPARAARDDAPRVLRGRALERAARERGAVPHGRAAAPSSRRRARRELGPHGREGRHLPVLRPLRRPEPRDGGRPAPVPRDRGGPGAGHRLAPDGSLPPATAAYRLRRPGARPRARPAPTAGARRGEHAEQCPVRGCVRRAPRGVVEERGEPSLPAPVPAAPPRQPLARALRGGERARRASRCRRRRSPTSTTSRRCSGTSMRSSATRARSSSTRSSATVRRCACLRRGRAAGGVVGGEERRRQALRGARGVRGFLPRRALRGHRLRGRARARVPGRARGGTAARSWSRSWVRSTAARASAWSMRPLEVLSALR